MATGTGEFTEDTLIRGVHPLVGRRLHLWRLLGALARSPADLAPLSRLALRYRAASRTLAAAARLGSLAPA